MRIERLIIAALVGGVACGDDATGASASSTGTTGSTGEPPSTSSGGESSATTTAASSSSSSATSTGETDTGPGPGDVDWPLLDCDPLVPSYCGLPFPSNVFSVADAETTTGRRVVLPPTSNGDLDAAAWAQLDGFSPSAAVMAHMPGATGAGLPGPDDFDASVAGDSPTVLLDAQTGERIPHFAELDRSTDDDGRRMLFLRPAWRLEGGRRYIAALRGVVDATGAPLPPTPAFAALRDDTPLAEEPSVDARRELYADVFARLGEAGVERGDLQLAWDFTTASDDAITSWMVHMRDDAFADIDTIVSSYEIDEVDDTWSPGSFLFRISGHFDAPLYLSNTAPGSGRLVLGDDGLPVASGTVEVPFDLIVPSNAVSEPVALIQHGHGLFGGRGQITAGNFQDLATTYGYAFFAVDWIGMAGEDSVPIGLAIAAGDTNGLVSMFDRMHQGTLHQLLAMRVVADGVANDPLLAGLIDSESRYYYGISQGGILGGVYMALSADVTRGVLDVMGQPYNLLLTRSVDFDTFFTVMRLRWPDPLDVMYGLAAVQMLWDRVEPSGYNRFIRDPLPGTPPHDVLLTAALGDHQVTTLGAHVMARSIPDLVHLDTGVRPLWGLDAVDGPHEGSALAEYSFGLPPDPPCNLPQTACGDPHGDLRGQDAAKLQIDTFLRTGIIDNFCPDGVCDYPDAAGCEPGAQTPDVCG